MFLQNALFDEKDDGSLVPNEFKPGLTIEKRIVKYGTRFEGSVGFCNCDARRFRPWEDCTHIKELRLRNLEKNYETVLDHIAGKRDERDKDNEGLEGAVQKISNHNPDEFNDLVEMVVRIAVQNGTVCSDDLHLLTNEAYAGNMIVGAVFASMVKAGVIEEVGRKRTDREIAHGRKINVYRLTEKGMKVSS